MFFWTQEKIYYYEAMPLELECSICDKGQLSFQCIRPYNTICEIPYFPFLKKKIISCLTCHNEWDYKESGVVVNDEDINQYLLSCKPKAWMFLGAIIAIIVMGVAYATDKRIIPLLF